MNSPALQETIINGVVWYFVSTMPQQRTRHRDVAEGWLLKLKQWKPNHENAVLTKPQGKVVTYDNWDV